MPELFSQVLDLKEKDVFLETEVNDTRYFSITGVPSIISYGKHPFSITFNDPLIEIPRRERRRERRRRQDGRRGRRQERRQRTERRRQETSEPRLRNLSNVIFLK